MFFMVWIPVRLWAALTWEQSLVLSQYFAQKWLDTKLRTLLKACSQWIRYKSQKKLQANRQLKLIFIVAETFDWWTRFTWLTQKDSLNHHKYNFCNNTLICSPPKIIYPDSIRNLFMISTSGIRGHEQYIWTLRKYRLIRFWFDITRP